MKVAAVEPQEPLTGETLLPDTGGSEAVAKKVVTASRKQWGREWQEDEKPEDNNSKKNTLKGNTEPSKNEKLPS